MTSDGIIYYDGEFMRRFEKLKDVIDGGDRRATHRFLIDNFGHIFKTFQYCAKRIAQGGEADFGEADEATKRELMRPLSHRQYRMIERAFSPWREEEALVIGAIWEFLYDDGRIYGKSAMSSAEVGGFCLILERVCVCLTQP